MRRIGYLVRAGATDQACVLLCAEGPALITRGVIAPVLRMIEQFPPAQRDGPQLQLLRGLGSWAIWDFDAMCDAMRRAAAGYAQLGDQANRQLALAYEAIAFSGAGRLPAADAVLAGLLDEPMGDEALACTLRAHMWQALDGGPLDQVAPRFHRELDVVERLDSTIGWYQASPVARYLGLPGIVPALQRYVTGALRHARDGHTPLRVLAVTVQAFLEVWAGRPDEADALLRGVEEDIRWFGQTRNLYTQTQLCRALLHALRGEAAAALTAMRRTNELMDEEPDGPRRRQGQTALLLHELRLAALLGDTVRLQLSADALERVPQHDIEAPARAQRTLLGAYLADAAGDSARAIAVRRAALQHGTLLSRLGLGVETRLRLAAALLPVEGAAAAAAVLGPALADTDDATEMAPVLLAGPAALQALARADWGPHLDAAAIERLRRWTELAQRLRRVPAAPPAPAAGDAMAGLSTRELEVLAHIASGDSNKLIARALDLSPHTVKRHVANILDKLAVQTRGQAAAWFRARR